MRRRPTIFAALCALPLVALGAAAQAPQPADTALPAPVGWVNDFAHVISPEKSAQIEAVIRDVNAKCGGSIVVVTLPTLGGRSRDEVALQLGRRWKVGRAGEVGDTLRGTGSVVLVVPAEHQWKIELGTRTSTFVTAAQAGEIGREQMVPAFRDGDFGEGILRGVTALAERYAAQYHFQLDAVPEAAAPAAQPANPPAYPPVTFAPPPDDHFTAATVAWVMLVALVAGTLIAWYRDRRNEDAYRIRPKTPRLRTTVVPPNPDAYRRRRKNPPLNIILQQEHGWGRSTGGGFGQSPPGVFGGSSGGFGFGSFGGGGGGGGGGFGGGGGGGGGVDFGGGGDFSGGGAGGSW